MEKRFPIKFTDYIFVLGMENFLIYLVKGKKCHALLESGVSFVVPLVLEQLDALGIDYAKIMYLVILHAHSDHVMGLPLLREHLSNAKTVGSENARRILGKEKVIKRFLIDDAKFGQHFLEASAISSIPTQVAVNIIPVDLVVGDGDLLDLGGKNDIQFIYSPGHSICGLSAYIPKDRTLLISDCAGFFLPPDEIFPLYFAGLKDYLKTLERLMSIKAKILGTAHQGIFYGNQVNKFLRDAISSTYRFRDFILERVKSGVKVDMLTQEVFEKMYRRELRMYPTETISQCAKLLVKRTMQ
jgi:glyoxylase-like metal-dependent hydrolase (beta-lactamase superfamily II)